MPWLLLTITTGTAVLGADGRGAKQDFRLHAEAGSLYAELR